MRLASVMSSPSSLVALKLVLRLRVSCQNRKKQHHKSMNDVSCPSLMSRTCTRSGPRPRGACRRCGARRGRTRARSASCPRTRAPRHCGTSGQTGSGHAWAPLDTQMRPALPQQQIPDEKKVYLNMIVILLLCIQLKI